MAVGAERFPGTVTTSIAFYADEALSVSCGCDRSESGGDRGHPGEDKYLRRERDRPVSL